ncbi:MAG: radical SAM protein [Myxococcota bacterium]
MEPIDLAAAWQRLSDVGQRVGLDDVEMERALARLVSAGGVLAQATGDTSEETRNRLMAGVARNLEDDPMVLGWALKLGARLGDVPWQRFFENFVVRLVTERPAIVARMRAEMGFPPPVTIIINPTMACNLRCRGCYAYEFSREESMAPALFERVVNEAREMGVRFITITGGEPFIYKPLMTMAERFPDMTFLTYSNGTLLDDKLADRVAAAGNIFPALSVEGYEAETDDRRGAGVHRGVLAAMARLKERGVLFGISVTPTRLNTDVVTADAFLDFYLDRGANFIWLFTYIPVGKSPEPQLMATPEQRDRLRETTLRWRRTRPVFIGDFWNDGATCGGCLSASRYAFICPDGKVQPCTFVHFYTHNIKDHSLKEIFQSPFFRTIRDAQPYHRNLLRPCKIIDHPHVLRQIVDTCGAQPAYEGADDLVRSPEMVAFIDDYARRYGELAERAWQGPQYQDGRRVLVPFSGLVDLYARFPDRMESAERNTPRTEASRPPSETQPVDNVDTQSSTWAAKASAASS